MNQQIKKLNMEIETLKQQIEEINMKIEILKNKTMNGEHMYYEKEFVYSHGRRYFKELFCKKYNGTIIGRYIDFDDLSTDEFNFQITIDGGFINTTFLEEADDQNILMELNSMSEVFSKDPMYSIENDDFMMFDFISFQLSELGLNKIPSHLYFDQIEFDDDDVKQGDRSYAFKTETIKNSYYHDLFTEILS